MYLTSEGIADLSYSSCMAYYSYTRYGAWVNIVWVPFISKLGMQRARLILLVRMSFELQQCVSVFFLL